MSKALGIIFGVLIIMLGIWCMMTPIETYGIIGWLIMFALIADGIGKISVWNDLRKSGSSDVLALVGGILSIILGVILACNLLARATVDIFAAYVIAFWALFSGCVRIGRAFQMRGGKQVLNAQLGSSWGVALVVGVLMVLIGGFCLFNPIIIMITIGWQIGFALIAGGVCLISATV